MAIISIYANYGVLGHDKQPVYSEGVHEEIYDELTVELPDYITRSVAVDGCGIYEIGGISYRFNDLAWTTKMGAPGLRWYDGHKEHFVALKVIDKVEH